MSPTYQSSAETIPHTYRQRSRPRPDLKRFSAQIDKTHKHIQHPPFWWTPDRSPDPVGTEANATNFRAQLKEVSPLLEVAWDHGENLWAVWVRLPRVQVPWCQGWARLFFVQSDHKFYPLNEVALATVYERDMRMQHTDALKYHDRCLHEVERAKARKKSTQRDEDEQRASEIWKHHQIQVSGYGKSTGNKHVNYHSGV